MKKLWHFLKTDWKFIVILWLVLIIIASTFALGFERSGIENKCIRSGYDTPIKYRLEWHCIGLRDGRPVIVPLSEVGN